MSKVPLPSAPLMPVAPVLSPTQEGHFGPPPTYEQANSQIFKQPIPHIQLGTQPPHAYQPLASHSQPGPATGTQVVCVVQGGHVLTPHPTAVVCPHCQKIVVTAVEYESGELTWLLVCGLFVFGCWMGCCLLPTCIDECKDAIHKCPECKQVIGKFERLR